MFLFATGAQAAMLGDIAPVREAREKLLAKKRLEAIRILQKALADEEFTSSRSAIQREIQNAKNIFLSNEGQKLYEQAESARYGGDQAVAKYQEALKVEPYHSRIIEGLILARLEKRECELAQAAIGDLKFIDENDNETLLLDFVAQSCIDKPSQELLTTEIKFRDHRFYERTFRARALQLNSQHDLAIRHADEASQLDSRYPTPYYWSWKARVANGASDEADDRAEKFLELCQNGGAALRRQYRFDPWVCRGTEEVKDYLNRLEKEGTT